MIKHKCIYEGVCYILSNGNILYEKDYRCTHDEATNELIQLKAEEQDAVITGGSVCCIVCGTPLMYVHEQMALRGLL